MNCLRVMFIIGSMHPIIRNMEANDYCKDNILTIIIEWNKQAFSNRTVNILPIFYHSQVMHHHHNWLKKKETKTLRKKGTDVCSQWLTKRKGSHLEYTIVILDLVILAYASVNSSSANLPPWANPRVLMVKFSGWGTRKLSKCSGVGTKKEDRCPPPGSSPSITSTVFFINQWIKRSTVQHFNCQHNGIQDFTDNSTC